MNTTMPMPILPGLPVVLQVNRVDMGLRRGQLGRVVVVEGASAVIECLGENGAVHTRLETPTAALIPIVCEPIDEALLWSTRVPAVAIDPDATGALSVALGVSRLVRRRP